MPDRPPDLIPLDDAARRVDRSRSTLRGWIRDGALQAWREDPDRPDNTRVLVSTAALMQLVVVSGKAARPGRPSARPPAPEALSALRAEHEALRQALVQALEGRVATLEGRAADLAQALASAKARADEWQARALRAEAEREALRVAAGLPWWRRLIGTGAAPG